MLSGEIVVRGYFRFRPLPIGAKLGSIKSILAGVWWAGTSPLTFIPIESHHERAEAVIRKVSSLFTHSRCVPILLDNVSYPNMTEHWLLTLLHVF